MIAPLSRRAERASSLHSREMTRVPYPRVPTAFFPTDFSADKTWRVWVVSGGESFGEIFMTDRPTLYIVPVGYIFFQIRLNGFELFTPAIPISQSEMIVPGPLGVADADLQIRTNAMPPAVIDVEIVRNR